MALTRTSLNLNQFIHTGSSSSNNAETDSSSIAPPSFYFDAFRSTTRVIKSPPKKQQPQQKEPVKKKEFTSPRREPGRETPTKPKRNVIRDENEDRNIDDGMMDFQNNFHIEDHMEDGESYLEVLLRMKEKHEQNLRLIEQMYYADTEGPRPPATYDQDHLLSLYDGSGGAFSARFTAPAPKKAWTGEPTKPAPFSFVKKNEGERKNQMGIARRRCLEYLAEVKEREEVELKKTFKANPIPRSTTEPRFQQMRDHWERRRDETKQLQAWSTTQDKAHDETFSFVKRDEERMRRKEWQREPEHIEVEHFHAKPIPWSVKVALYDRLQQDNEERRKKRIAERAAKMLKKSSLPQRMAIYERTKGQKKRLLREAAQKQNENSQPKLRKSHDVPDFEKLQSHFQHNLEKARQSKSLTKPVAFSFSARPIKLRDRHEEECSQPKRTPRYKRDPNPPQPTKKFLDAVAHLNAKIEEKKRQEEEAAEAAAKLRMDPEKRKVLADRIRAHMLDNSAELERRHEESLRAARERDRQLAKETSEKLREMQDRVDSRPLLLESSAPNSSAKRLARQKALISVKESLINAGISDYKTYFSEEELKDLEITDL